MLTNDGDISTNMRNEEDSMSDDEKKFLYARAVHSSHSIQYHMHQIMEQQKGVQKHDDGKNGSDSSRVKSTQIGSGDHLTNHKYDQNGQFLAPQDI